MIVNGEPDHFYKSNFLEQICQQLQNPVIISKYVAINTIDFYLNLELNGKWTLVGIEIDPNDNSIISTIFWRSLKYDSGSDRNIMNVQYVNTDDYYSKTKKLIDSIDRNTASLEVLKKLDELKKSPK